MNPFVGGPGTAPPYLAGREPVMDRLMDDVAVLREGGVVQGVALHGPRGVGKTVLLNEFARRSQEAGDISVRVVARPDLDEGIVASLVHGFPKAISEIRGLSRRGAKSLSTAVEQTRTKLGAGLVEFEVTTKHNVAVAPGLAVQDLLVALATAAAKASQVVVITVDELQAGNPRDLRALSSLIQLVNVDRLGVSITLAGLPNTVSKLSEAGASSFTERLDWQPIVNLDPYATGEAIRVPLERDNITISAVELRSIFHHSDGYPYAVQLLGRSLYDLVGPTGAVEPDHVEAAAVAMERGLHDGVYLSSWTKLSDKEQWYVAHAAAIAAAAGGPGVATRELLESLDVTAAAVSTIRTAVIHKGVLYSPRRGDLAFTVPGLANWILHNHSDALTSR